MLSGMSKLLSRPVLCAAVAASLFACVAAHPMTASAKGKNAAFKAEVAGAEKCHGKVTAVDAKSGTITIHEKKGGDMTLTTTSETRIKVNHAKASLDDVKIGMEAMVRTEDKTTALVVNAHDPKKSSAE